MTATKGDRTTKSQLERFKKTARELEADEDETAFEEKLRQIAKAQAEKAKSDKR